MSANHPTVGDAGKNVKLPSALHAAPTPPNSRRSSQSPHSRDPGARPGKVPTLQQRHPRGGQAPTAKLTATARTHAVPERRRRTDTSHVPAQLDGDGQRRTVGEESELPKSASVTKALDHIGATGLWAAPDNPGRGQPSSQLRSRGRPRQQVAGPADVPKQKRSRCCAARRHANQPAQLGPWRSQAMTQQQRAQPATHGKQFVGNVQDRSVVLRYKTA